MTRLPVVAALVLVVAACGGTNSGNGASDPRENPGEAMQRLIQYELSGKLASSYAMLVREQRAVVARALYLRCRPGPPLAGVSIAVLGISEETIHVPAIGPTSTKAVRWRMTIPDANGDPMIQSDTGHLIAQDGEWRWTLSPSSFASFKQSVCPY